MRTLPSDGLLHPFQGGRSLNRYFGHHRLERARHQSHGPAAQRDRKRRPWLHEPNFAGATTQHGFKRVRWRELAEQTIQDQLIATPQNLRILLRRAGLGYLATLDFLQMCFTQLAAIRSGFPFFGQANFAWL